MHPIRTIKKFFADGYGGLAFWSNWTTPGKERDFLRKYQGYVYACISAIAEDVAMIQFQVFRKLQDGSLVETPTHSLLKTLDNPNPLMSKYQLLEMTQTHIELTGESFWYSEIGEQTGKPKSFYILPPDRMNVAIDTTGQLPRIAGYVFNKENGQKVPLEPQEITHFKMPNPWDAFRGYGTVEAALLYIQTERFGSEFTRNYIYNNAMPAGIVSVKGNIDKPQFDEVKRQWKQEYGTLAKAGKTAFVKGLDVEFTKVGTTLGEAALKEIKDMSRDDIMTMFRVSKPILGIFDDVNLASAKTAQYVFMSRVIDPKMSRMVDTLQFVLNRWNSGNLEYVLGYESPVPEDVDDKLKVYEAALDNWMTVNEVRKEEGLEPVDGGNQIRRPLQLVPIGDPPKPSGTKATKRGDVIVKRTIKRVVAKPKNLDYERKESFRQELISNQEVWARKFHSEMRTRLDKQHKQILDNLKETTSKTAKKKAFEGYTFNQDDANQDFIDHLLPLEYELVKQQGALALGFLGEDELDFQLSETVRRSIEDRIRRMSANFNQETIDAITDQLIEATANNESLADIKKRIAAVYRDGGGYRSERAARTETSDASNAAAKEAYAQTGYITKIEWFANPGACQYCQELNGNVIAITDNYVDQGDSIEGVDGGTYAADYDAIDAPPAHPNCTCTILPVRE